MSVNIVDVTHIPQLRRPGSYNHDCEGLRGFASAFSSAVSVYFIFLCLFCFRISVGVV